MTTVNLLVSWYSADLAEIYQTSRVEQTNLLIDNIADSLPEPELAIPMVFYS